MISILKSRPGASFALHWHNFWIQCAKRPIVRKGYPLPVTRHVPHYHVRRKKKYIYIKVVTILTPPTEHFFAQHTLLFRIFPWKLISVFLKTRISQINQEKRSMWAMKIIFSIYSRQDLKPVTVFYREKIYL